MTLDILFWVLLLMYLIYSMYDNRYNVEETDFYIKELNIYENMDNQSKFIKRPNILLEGFDPEKHNENINPDFDNLYDELSPSFDMLNDRYNPYKSNYSDFDLYKTTISKTNMEESEENYTETLLNDILNSDVLDADQKINYKQQRNQKLAKESDAIAANKSKNSIVNDFSNEFGDENDIWWGAD